jgi:hypothetical protein
LSFFEFVLIITSVIYALSIAQLLAGISRIAQSDLEQKLYLPHAGWVTILFLSTLLTWWSLWEFRDIEWTFAAYVLLVMQPVVIYFACSLIAPNSLATSTMSLEDHFSRIRHPLLITYLINLTIASSDGALLLGEPMWHVGRYFHIAIAASIILGIICDGKKTRIAVSALILTFMSGVITVRFWTPPG